MRTCASPSSPAGTGEISVLARLSPNCRHRLSWIAAFGGRPADRLGQAAMLWPALKLHGRRLVADRVADREVGRRRCVRPVEAKVGRIGDADIARAAELRLPDVAAAGCALWRLTDRPDPAPTGAGLSGHRGERRSGRVRCRRCGAELARTAKRAGAARVEKDDDVVGAKADFAGSRESPCRPDRLLPTDPKSEPRGRRLLPPPLPAIASAQPAKTHLFILFLP